jgi:hypothetical protein
MGDSAGSLLQLMDFMSYWRHPSRHHKWHPKVMAVVQGQTLDECKQHVMKVA